MCSASIVTRTSTMSALVMALWLVRLALFFGE